MGGFQLLVIIFAGVATLITSIGVIWRKVLKPLVDAAFKIKEGIDIFTAEFVSDNGHPKFRTQFEELIRSNQEIADRVSALEKTNTRNTADLMDKIEHSGYES
jgi:hypothetical protein